MKPAFSVHPEPVLRGTRDYYHSTDLYEALVAGLAGQGIEPSAFDLKMKERITGCPRIDFFGDGPVDASPALAAVATFEEGARRWLAHVCQEPDPIVARKPYDETAIWQRVWREDRAFVAEGCTGVSPIEVVTAVAVHAHRTVLPPVAGRWLLAQMTARRMLGPSELDYFRFELGRQLGPNMTQSHLADRSGSFGKALFILK